VTRTAPVGTSIHSRERRGAAHAADAAANSETPALQKTLPFYLPGTSFCRGRFARRTFRATNPSDTCDINARSQPTSLGRSGCGCHS
jgi:hypothetical protein